MSDVNVALPEWAPDLEFSERALDRFIYSQEPAGEMAEQFRADLAAVIAEAVAAHSPAAHGEPNERLRALADRIDHEQLWRRPAMEHFDWPQDKKDRLEAGVQLRRYAEFFGQNCWRIFPPTRSLSFRAGTLDAVVEMARKHDARTASPAQPTDGGRPYTYASTQATKCAECGEHKHTPLRIDAMGGYVCLTCIDRKLGRLLGEFGYPAEVPQWSPMAEAPLDGTLVRLLVKFDNHAIEDTAEPTATIGSHNDGEWNFVGWDWHRDEWARGSGDLLGWLPLLAAP